MEIIKKRNQKNYCMEETQKLVLEEIWKYDKNLTRNGVREGRQHAEIRNKSE